MRMKACMLNQWKQTIDNDDGANQEGNVPDIMEID